MSKTVSLKLAIIFSILITPFTVRPVAKAAEPDLVMFQFCDNVGNATLSNSVRDMDQRLHYSCAVASIYNVSCEAIQNYPVNFLTAEIKTKNMETIEALRQTISGPAIPLTHFHRSWLPSESHPEVPEELLGFYRNSVKLHKGEAIVDHFWCYDCDKVPETLKAISNFDPPVIVHEIKEIENRFIAKELFLKFLNDGMRAFASSLLRREILVLHGGIHADISIEELHNNHWFLTKWPVVLCVKNNWVDNHFIAAEKGSPFLSKSLSLIAPLMRSLAQINPFVSYTILHGFLSIQTFQLLMAMEDKTFTEAGHFYEGLHYRHHGMSSWTSQVQKLSLAYFLGEKSATITTGKVSPYAFICPLGELHGVTPCAKMRTPIPQYNVETDPSLEPINPNAPDLIERKHHRLWVTSAKNPKEIDEAKLTFYRQSLELYPSDFEHYFWCYNCDMMPETIKAISGFEPKVMVRDLTEVLKSFINEALIKLLLADEFYAIASDLIRQEIILHEGGHYADAGTKLLVPLDNFFKKFDRILCIRKTWIDNHFIAGAKGSAFFRESLSRVEQNLRHLHEIGVNSHRIFEVLATKSWRLTLALNNEELSSIAVFYDGIHYEHYGDKSWDQYINNVTLSYLITAYTPALHSNRGLQLNTNETDREIFIEEDYGNEMGDSCMMAPL